MSTNKRKDAEQAVLKFVKSWKASYGISFRDIQEATGLPLGTVHSVVQSLHQEGRLRYHPGISRSVGKV